MKASEVSYKSVLLRDFVKSGTGLIIAVIILLIILPFLHINAAHRADMPIIWGDQTEAIFDLWSFQHILSGILISLIASALLPSRISRGKFLLVILLVALSWEAVELALEIGFFGQTALQWKHGYEHWGNRMIGDPAMVMLGSVIAPKLKSFWRWILVLAAIWLFGNIAAPNSMVIQNWLGL
ncbi:MAG: hypothetical protein Q8P32_01070 [Candidatus Komeilibacteria bacterium]|nr:hypothetical protein [Candidatus Komeilibacteria bacterium]